MNYKEELKQKLKKYSRNDIIFTNHALIRANQRNIDLDEVKENIINPRRLHYAEKQHSDRSGEEKYNCYFIYSKTLCHRYVLIINKRIIICTLVKINRRWQRRVEKHAKI